MRKDRKVLRVMTVLPARKDLPEQTELTARMVRRDPQDQQVLKGHKA